MSQENVEIVRSANKAWDNGDMDTLRDLYDPDIIIRMEKNWPEPGPFVGIEAVLRQWVRLREAYDVQTLEEVSELVAVGNRVACKLRWVWHRQGPEVDMEFTSIATVRNGRIVTIDFFWDHTEALEAVGLSEQDAHADS